MADYAKLKNAELETMLKERGLPHAGKKADMVARLQEDDTKKEASKSSAAIPDEDVIDYDDEETEAPAASSKAGAAVIAAGGKGPIDNPQAVPNQVADVDPSTTDDLAVKPPTEDATETDANTNSADAAPKPPPVDFTRGLAATNLETEIEKRKKRAEKFGIKLDDDKEAQEALQKLERAKKFGESGGPKGLDEALPTERPKKRGREGGDQVGRGRFNKRRGGPQQAGRRRGPGEQSGNGNGSWMSSADRDAAAKRAARWA